MITYIFRSVGHGNIFVTFIVFFELHLSNILRRPRSSTSQQHNSIKHAFSVASNQIYLCTAYLKLIQGCLQYNEKTSASISSGLAVALKSSKSTYIKILRYVFSKLHFHPKSSAIPHSNDDDSRTSFPITLTDSGTQLRSRWFTARSVIFISHLTNLRIGITLVGK